MDLVVVIYMNVLAGYFLPVLFRISAINE